MVCSWECIVLVRFHEKRNIWWLISLTCTIFSWKVGHVHWYHACLFTCPQHLFPLFSVWSVCNYQMLCGEDEANTVGVGLAHNFFSVSVYLHLFFHETSKNFMSLPASECVPHFLFLLHLLILSYPSLICSFLIASIPVSPSLLSCFLLLHALEVS